MVTLRPSAAGEPPGSLAAAVALTATVTVASTLDRLQLSGVVGIDMPLGLVADGWRVADVLARRALGRRGVTIFTIPPRPVWERKTYAEANRACRELTGKGLSAQTWGLRGKLLEADAYRRASRARLSTARLHEVHPELSVRRPCGRAARRQQAHRGGPRRPQGTAGAGWHNPATQGRRRGRARPARRRRRMLVRPPHRRRRCRHPHQPCPARRRRHRDSHPLLVTSQRRPRHRASGRPRHRASEQPRHRASGRLGIEPAAPRHRATSAPPAPSASTVTYRSP